MGYTAGFVAISGWPAFPPGMAEQVVPWLGLAGGLLGAGYPLLQPRPLARRGAFAALAVLALWLLQRKLYESPWSGAAAVLVPLLLAAAACAHFWLVEELARRLPGVTFPLPHAVVAAAAAPVLFLAGSLSFARHAGALSASLLGFAAAGTLFGPSFWRPAAPALALLLPSLLLTGYLRTYEFSAASGFLLLLAPAGALAGDLAFARALHPLPRLLLRIGGAGVPAAVAAGLARMSASSGGY